MPLFANLEFYLRVSGEQNFVIQIAGDYVWILSYDDYPNPDYDDPDGSIGITRRQHTR